MLNNKKLELNASIWRKNWNSEMQFSVLTRKTKTNEKPVNWQCAFTKNNSKQSTLKNLNIFFQDKEVSRVALGLLTKSDPTASTLTWMTMLAVAATATTGSMRAAMATTTCSRPRAASIHPSGMFLFWIFPRFCAIVNCKLTKTLCRKSSWKQHESRFAICKVQSSHDLVKVS